MDRAKVGLMLMGLVVWVVLAWPMPQPLQAAIYKSDEPRGQEVEGPMGVLDASVPQPGQPQEEEAIPAVSNGQVARYIRYFQGPGRGLLLSWLQRASSYLPVMRGIFRENKVPSDLVYMSMVESGFQTHATSWAKAVGPWQFTEATGRRYGLVINRWIDERRDPLKSTGAASRYLKDLHERFNSWVLAKAGYNAGEGRLERAMRCGRSREFWDLVKTACLSAETKTFVPTVMAVAIIAKDAEQYGFSLPEEGPPLRFDEVEVAEGADLRLIARSAGTTLEEIKRLNPALRGEVTPLNYPGYRLRLPLDTGATFWENFPRLQQEAMERKLRTRSTSSKQPAKDSRVGIYKGNADTHQNKLTTP